MLNKPAKMVVHPACGNSHGTLVNALLFQCNKLSKEGGEIRRQEIQEKGKGATG
jgi:23S rRNA pseudouridine1911/1915/1917 synthase